MRMAARRKRSSLAIAGATAVAVIGGWAAIALGAPAFTAPALTRLPVNLSWSDGAATGYSLSRAPGACTAPGSPVDLSLVSPTQTTFSDSPADGHYCYAVTGTYGDATPPTSSADVWVDNTPPTVPAFSSAIFPGATVHGNVMIGASSSDPEGGSGVVTTTITINGTLFASGASSAIGSWNTSIDGPYTLVATSTDAAGNQSATAPISVTVDNTPPVAFTIFAPSPVAGSPTLSWGGADTYTASRDGVSVGAVSSPWTDPGNPAPGSHTYVITASDGAGNQRGSSVTVLVLPLSVTAPQELSASSPTNDFPHLTWQKPETFAVTSWQVYRDGVVVAANIGSNTTSFDDTTVPTQGPHVYVVQALSDTTLGDKSGSVSVIYDTTPPALDPASATANPNGSISVNWPDATDPPPGSGISKYLVRRGSGTPAPPDTSSGTAVCTLTPPANVCADSGAKSGTTYGYAVFAIDAAGNLARREAGARAADTQPPDAVAGLKIVSFDRTYARLGWTVPALKGADEDLAGYRVIQLRAGAKAPLSPQDGTVVCRNDDPKDSICDALNLTTGKKITFAVYALDEVPNYSAPMVISMVPHSIDRKPPHKPTKVRLVRDGVRYTLTWVSPRDRDLSKFRVTLFDKRPAPRPSKGKAIVTGRVLHASFTLRPGQRVYVNLFALDVSGNFSRVSRLIVVPKQLIVPKSKHKGAKKQSAGKKTGAKPLPAKTKTA
jgi:hypothetical protein